jgi:ATP-dependent DNA helicase RecG
VEVNSFIQVIRNAYKVSDFIKQLDKDEILRYYQMINADGSLTNLGLLWLGYPHQRARISYPITVQYIVYNEREEKIRKTDWHFHNLNPRDLLVAIEKEAVDLLTVPKFQMAFSENKSGIILKR